MECLCAAMDHVLVDPKRSQAGLAASAAARGSETVPAGVQQLNPNPAHAAARPLLP
jgi:hypothetical protein